MRREKTHMRKIILVLIVFGFCLSAGHVYARDFLCEPVSIEGNSILFKASNPAYKHKACYQIYMKVQRWNDGINRYDGGWRDSLAGVVWEKNDYYVCPPGDEEYHSYRLTFGLPSQKTGEIYCIKIRVYPGDSYTLRLVY